MSPSFCSIFSHFSISAIRDLVIFDNAPGALPQQHLSFTGDHAFQPCQEKNGTVQLFTLTGTGFVPQGTTRVALYCPGTSTVFVEGESNQVISIGHMTGQFVLPESPSHRFSDF
jgi:hypothetical protein